MIKLVPCRRAAAVLVALGVNCVLFSLVSLLTFEKYPARDLTNPVGVSLVSLPPPEPPPPEKSDPEEKPKPPVIPDFIPDLAAPPSFAPPGFDVGLTVNVGDPGTGPSFSDFVFDESDLDAQPQPIVTVPPIFPYRARQRGIEGNVHVKLLIREDGSVGRIVILDATPEGVFENSVLKAAADWRYKPGRIAGKPVSAWIITNIRFKLN